MAPHAAWRCFRYLIVEIAFCACVQGQVHFRLEPRALIERRLKSFNSDNQSREDLIHTWFARSGCAKRNLSEQPAKAGLPPNVICVLPGETDEVIVVGAHTDKVMSAGDGVVDNWTGASLLPSLLFSLSAEKRHHIFVFVGFSAEEEGMIGSAYYVNHLTPEQRGHVQAMVNMDSLGLGPTKVWASHADRVLLDALTLVAARSKLPVSTGNVDNLGTSDSESFARYHIPRVTLHSVTQENMRVLHSPNDKLATIKVADYYDSYHLIVEYLAYLDDVLKPAPAATPDKAAH